MYLPISRLAINTKKHFVYKKAKLIKQTSIKTIFSWHIDTQLRHPQMKYSGLGVALCVRFFQF